MRFPFEFISPTVVDIEESYQEVAIISGTLLREGVSRNGNIYTISEMEKIANQAVGVPIYVGTMTKRDPNTGLLMKNMHANLEKNKVGEIIRTKLDKASRKIKFWAKIFNTVIHPHIIEEVKKGWGISIGGIATKAKFVIDKLTGKILTKIADLILNHIQLLPPTTLTGVPSAKVEKVEIQESMILYCNPETGICYYCPEPPEPKKESTTINLRLQLHL